jgi:hypothetical protein
MATPQVDGIQSPEPQDVDQVEGGSVQAKRANGIPPAESYEISGYVKRITIPLNKTYAFTLRKRLRVVAIGAGYSGVILAQKLMDQIVEHIIYKARDSVGGTWAANTYPGIKGKV